MKKITVMVSMSSLLLMACGGGGGNGGQPSEDLSTGQLKEQSHQLNSIDPAYGSDADLAAFGAAVGDKQIVVLTEPMHGLDEPVQLNTRLLQYLHKNKGFDLVLIESSMFDLSRMHEIRERDKASYLESAPGRIFYGWSRHEATLKMAAYLEKTADSAKPLRFAGIDQFQQGISSTTEFVPRFVSFLQQRKSPALANSNWKSYFDVASAIAEQFEDAPRPSAAQLAAFNEVSAQLDQELCTVPYAGEPVFQSPSYWCRLSKTLQQETHYLWHDDQPDAKSSEQWHQPRDIAQAANAKWWLDGPYKGKKAIIWTHTFHGLKDSLTNSLGRRVVNTATELEKYYPGQIYTVHISESQTASVGSLEERFKQIGGMRYIHYPSDPALQSRLKNISIRENGLMQQQPNYFGASYQTLFVLPQMNPAPPDWNKYPTKRWPQPLLP